jgi:PAS domain S-box-containing protein
MEDDQNDAWLTQERLEQEGFRIDIAGDGERGLAMLESGAYDAALVKYRLAGVDGPRFLKTLAKKKPGLPVVLVIGAGDASAAFEVLEQDAIDCIVKDAAGEYLERLPAVIERAIGKRRAERALREAEDRLARARDENLLMRNAIESLSDGFSLYDSEDRLVIWNENMRRTFPDLTDFIRPGMTFEAVVRAFVERGYASIGDADPEEWIPARVERHRRCVQVPDFRRPNGRWIQVNEYRTADGGTAMVRTDITERKRTEEALQESESTLRTLIDSGATDIMALLDLEGRIRAANDRTALAFGLTSASIIGRHITEFMPADVAQRRMGWFDEVLATGRAVRYEDERDGMSFDSVFSPVVGADGRVVAVAVIAHDVTERKKAERDQRRAREAAAAADNAKSEFLARMSHDMRVPLNSILGFSEMIGAEFLGPVGNRKYVEYGWDIHESGERLLSLLNDIVDLSKIEAGMFEIADDAVDVAAIVHSTTRLIDPQARAAELVMETDDMPALPLVRGDRNALTRVIENLLSNAIRFTPGGGNILLSVVLDDVGSMVIRISDTGIGIAPADISKALSPFGQIASAEINKQSGVGLGLPIVRHLVELHDGVFELESAVGAGTTAIVRLPAGRVLAGS